MKSKIFTFILLLASVCVTDIQAEGVGAFNADSVYNSLYRQLSRGGSDVYSCDIPYSDAGTSDFFRSLWNINELSSDEFLCGWGDEGISDIDFGTFTPDNRFVEGLYLRHSFLIQTANSYLENAPASLTTQRAEVRLIRAYLYMNLIDLFGDVPFTTSSKVTNNVSDEYRNSQRPAKKSRAEVFNFIESELQDCVNGLPDDHQAKQYRPDKVAAWLLLARLYLNAEIYTGKSRWSDAKAYAKKVMDSKYTLCPNYSYLFMGDNNSNGAEKELILPIYEDGTDMQSYGGTTFVIASTSRDDNGMDQHWTGNRLRENMVTKFFSKDNVPSYASATEMVAKAGDDRAMLNSRNCAFSNTELGDFYYGLECRKFTNTYSTGATPHNTNFADTDIPFLRKAEAYLIYAEADARLNGGSCSSDGLAAYNAIRSRAHAATTTSVTTDDICDEWAREVYGEARRRSDLIRFGKYTGGNYNWTWKGGTYIGSSLDNHYALLPLPTKVMLNDESYAQNPGYFDINTIKFRKPYTLTVNEGKGIDLKSQDLFSVVINGPAVEGIGLDTLVHRICMVPQRWAKRGLGYLPIGTGIKFFYVGESVGSKTVISSELVDSCLTLLTDYGAKYGKNQGIASPKSINEPDTLLFFSSTGYGGKYIESDTLSVIVQPYAPWKKGNETTYAKFAMNHLSYGQKQLDLKNLMNLTFAWTNDVDVFSTDDTNYSLYVSTDGFKSGDGTLLYTTREKQATIDADYLSKVLSNEYGYTLPYQYPKDGVLVSLRCQADNGFGVKSNSDTIMIKVLPYYQAPKIETWYLVGACIGDGKWDNYKFGVGKSLIPLYANDDIFDDNGKGTISWTGYLDDSGFRIVKNPGSWEE